MIVKEHLVGCCPHGENDLMDALLAMMFAIPGIAKLLVHEIKHCSAVSYIASQI